MPVGWSPGAICIGWLSTEDKIKAIIADKGQFTATSYCGFGPRGGRKKDSSREFVAAQKLIDKGHATWPYCLKLDRI